MTQVAAGVVLAKSGEAVKAGPIGLAVILLLCIACYFLFKSMSKHMREVRENFPTEDPPKAATTPVAGADVRRAELIRTDPAGTKPALPPGDGDEPRPERPGD